MDCVPNSRLSITKKQKSYHGSVSGSKFEEDDLIVRTTVFTPDD